MGKRKCDGVAVAKRAMPEFGGRVRQGFASG
ncbi:hypothetical protein ACVWXN_001531 [Bradyrhizobium sp. i1.4.4]